MNWYGLVSMCVKIMSGNRRVKELLREMIGQVVGRTIEWKKRPTG